jgi:hypothetical protein
MHKKFNEIEEGTFFEFNGEKFVKIRDTGYVFAIANSKNLETYRWELVPVNAMVKVLSEK